MDKQTIEQMIAYIEEVEIQIECQWGDCRSLKTLVRDNAMPDLYNKLLNQLENNS